MTFSIAIPAYKQRYLREAILSVIGQTYTEWELVIVDDCSPEDIRTIVEPYLSDNRLRYYRNETNCGAVNVVDNWNSCLGYCTGDYVICMGDDDRLLPNCLETYHQLIGKYPDLNVYHARTEIIDDQGEVINLQEPRPEWESALSLVWNRWASRNKQFIGDFCYRTDYLKRAGGYYKLPLAWGSDDITATLAAMDKGIANTQQFSFQYRENALTITSSSAFAKVKMQATLTQYDWYGRFLATLRHSSSAADGTVHHTSLTPDDAKYLSTIEVPRRQYYYNSLGRNCSDYIKGNPLRLLECYRQMKPLRFPKTAFAKWYLASLMSIKTEN